MDDSTFRHLAAFLQPIDVDFNRKPSHVFGLANLARASAKSVVLRISLGIPKSSSPRQPSIQDALFLAWIVSVHSIAKKTEDEHAVPDLKDWNQSYFIYVCQKTAKLDGDKDNKKKALEYAKSGKKLRGRKKKVGMGV